MKNVGLFGLILILILATIVSVLAIQTVISSEAQSPYVALMLICGGTYDSSNLHMAEFPTEGEAKTWADAELQGVWDLAYIYQGYENGALHLISAKSQNVSCFPDVTDWTTIP